MLLTEGHQVRHGERESQNSNIRKPRLGDGSSSAVQNQRTKEDQTAVMLSGEGSCPAGGPGEQWSISSSLLTCSKGSS